MKRNKGKAGRAAAAPVREALRAAADLLPEEVVAGSGHAATAVRAGLDVCTPDYLVDCLIELGREAAAGPEFWGCLRRAAAQLPELRLGGYQRRHSLPRRERAQSAYDGLVTAVGPVGAVSAQHLLLARRRSDA
jgi:hypothetical protein